MKLFPKIDTLNLELFFFENLTKWLQHMEQPAFSIRNPALGCPKKKDFSAE